jgi:hypothetical protein
MPSFKDQRQTDRGLQCEFQVVIVKVDCGIVWVLARNHSGHILEYAVELT